MVDSKLFGGSIQAAGLLTVDDYLATIKDNQPRFDLLIIPSISFDSYGKDLTDKHYSLIEEMLDCKVELI